MTIKLRGRLFWSFFSLAGAGLVLAGAGLWLVGTETLLRLGESGLGGNGATGFYTLLVSAGLCGLYAVAVSGLVAFRSGRTVSVEIFFFAVWAFCQGFELTRLISVKFVADGASAMAFETITRLALFGRYSGSMAVFAGSLFSVGLKQERGGPVLGTILLAGLLFASIQPLNSVGPGHDLLADRGMAALAGIFEMSMLVMALVNLVLAWKTSKDSAFGWAGVGLAMCVIASMGLRMAYWPWVAVLGFPALVAGTGLHIKSLHDYYLWR